MGAGLQVSHTDPEYIHGQVSPQKRDLPSEHFYPRLDEDVPTR